MCTAPSSVPPPVAATSPAVLFTRPAQLWRSGENMDSYREDALFSDGAVGNEERLLTGEQLPDCL